MGIEMFEGYSLKDLLPAIAILGPILAALLTILVTWRLRERKILSFHIWPTETLTEGLRTLREPVTLKYGDVEVKDLNRAFVTLWNVGNSTVKDIAFEIVVSGIHQVCTTNVEAGPHLERSIKISEKELEFDKTFTVRVPFLNSGEELEIALFYDGDDDRPNVLCRIEGVQTRIVKVTEPGRSVFSFSGRIAQTKGADAPRSPVSDKQPGQALLRRRPAKRHVH